MYRDSKLGLCIDLDGPDGNAWALMGYTLNLSGQTGKDGRAICNEMRAKDYDNVIKVFEREFGDVVTLINKPGEGGR